MCWMKLPLRVMENVRKSIHVKVIDKSIVFEERIVPTMHVRDHLNVFNRLTIQFLSVETNIEEEDQVLLLLTSLPPSYDTLVTTLLVDKET